MASRKQLVNRLRVVSWTVVVLAVVAALQTPATTAPGGPTLGLFLAGILTLVLKTTEPKPRRKARR